MVPSKHQLNPYYLGYKIFEDIEKRYGRDYMFEVRELDSDQSFLRNYLTKELVEDLDLYVFEKRGQEWGAHDFSFNRLAICGNSAHSRSITIGIRKKRVASLGSDSSLLWFRYSTPAALVH